MTNRLDLFKCDVCGNIVQVLVSGAGELVCCGESMRKLEQKNEKNELSEKHIPEVLEEENKTIVRMTKHPMTEEHYIMFIQSKDNNKNEVYTKFFNPNEQVEFDVSDKNIDAVCSYCNIHGLY